MCLHSQYANLAQDAHRTRALRYRWGKLQVLRKFVLKPARLISTVELVLQSFILPFQIGCLPIRGHTLTGALRRHLVFEAQSDRRRVQSDQRSYPRRIS